MISVPPGVRIWLAARPVDMRKGFDGLAAVVQQHLGQDPFSGQIFAFRGKRGDLLKLLVWDSQGFLLVAKRLEKGQLAALRRRSFGHSSEKLGRVADQLELQIEDLEQHQAEHAAAAVPATPVVQPAERVHPIRKPLPAHLPREDEELAPPYAACPGCGGALRRIGEDVSRSRAGWR